jgi:hypothetical protein
MLSPLNSSVSPIFADEGADDFEPACGGQVLFELAWNSRHLDASLQALRDAVVRHPGSSDGPVDEDYVEVFGFEDVPITAA